MPIERRASSILNAFEKAETEIVGKAVVLTDGKAGTVEKCGSTSLTVCASRLKATMQVACLNHQERARTRPFARTTSSLRLGKLIRSEVNRLTFFEDAPFF